MKTATMPLALTLKHLLTAYRTGNLTPTTLIKTVYERIDAYGDPAVWIELIPLDQALQQAQRLAAFDPATLPLYGIPFAIKDNIDWAGVPTTAGCPEFAYTPTTSSPVVKQLCAAGAILVGKTNLDQFATGLVGTRTPYGVCRNPFDAAYIPGGSSAGSAVAVAAGLVSFALGTDTAGSGRVPAAFNNIIGLKPSRGALSTRGVVPAVRSLDCLSIFALTCADAAAIHQVAAQFDDADPFARPWLPRSFTARLRLGIPPQPTFLGNAEAEHNYYAALERLQALGHELVTIDYAPFAAAAKLLYEGAWLAERTAAVGEFIQQDLPGIDPVVKAIILGGYHYDAIATFRALYELQILKRAAAQQWQQMDVLALPTTPTIYRVEEIAAEPTKLNANLGLYTNFVNLLDLCGLAVPSGFQSNGLPTGLTLLAPAGYDQALCQVGSAYHAQLGGTLGATGQTLEDYA